MSDAIGTQQNPWNKVPTTANAADLHAASQWLYAPPPTTPPTGTTWLPSVDISNNLALMFYGNAAGKRAQARIWGVTRISYGGGTDGLVGKYLGTLDLHIGANGAATGVFSGGYKFIEQVEPLEEATPAVAGFRFVGMLPGGSVMVTFDSLGYSGFFIELTCKASTGDSGDNASEIGFLWRPL